MIPHIKLALYDFDGVMTDNTALMDERGSEYVKVNRSDGLAVKLISELGIDQIIVSTEANPIVSKRAEKLKISCFQDVTDKTKAVKEITCKNGVKLEETVFIGNDINDLGAMNLCGYALCPKDARDEIKAICHKILPSLGGHGVIRDFYDFLKKEQKF